MTIRILLVDDHTLFRSGLKALLSRQSDFEVVGEAADGLEGVKLAEQLKPDLHIAQAGYLCCWDIAYPRLDLAKLQYFCWQFSIPN